MEPFRLLFFLIGAAEINFYDYDPEKKKNSAADPIRERPIFQKLVEEELQENDLHFYHVVHINIQQCVFSLGYGE